MKLFGNINFKIVSVDTTIRAFFGGAFYLQAAVLVLQLSLSEF
jgi:hypothetical protein